MFTKNPEYKDHFPKLAKCTPENLLTSPQLITQANNVMEFFDLNITELDDADATHAKIKKLGADTKAQGSPDTTFKVRIFF